MRVTFANRRLDRCYHARSAATREWIDNIGDRYIRSIELMKMVSSMQDLRAYPSLRLHRLHGRRAGQFAISLNARWRLIFTHDDYEETIRILEVSNHYDD